MIHGCRTVGRFARAPSEVEPAGNTVAAHCEILNAQVLRGWRIGLIGQALSGVPSPPVR